MTALSLICLGSEGEMFSEQEVSNPIQREYLGFLFYEMGRRGGQYYLAQSVMFDCNENTYVQS